MNLNLYIAKKRKLMEDKYRPTLTTIFLLNFYNN